MKIRASVLRAAMACAALLLCSSAVVAQSWPARPVHLIVPFPVGGGTDLVARLIATRLSTAIGQPIVVENRPGAGGTIGAGAVAKAAPDGYTIGIATSSTHPAAMALLKDVPYDSVASFAPIVLIARTSFVLLGSAALPASTIPELVAFAKANPGKLTIANVGTSTLAYLLTQQLKLITGTEMLDVGYRGAGPVYTDLLANQVELFLDNPGASTPLVEDKRLKALAVTGATPSLPTAPLFAQAGLPGFDHSFWYGFVAPAGTPPAIVSRIHTEVARYLQSEEGKKELISRSLQAAGDDPAAFAEAIRRDADLFKELAVRLKIKAE
jgi:tripartite-type tricarboxylate transporter receptor subunit TctC